MELEYQRQPCLEGGAMDFVDTRVPFRFRGRHDLHFQAGVLRSQRSVPRRRAVWRRKREARSEEGQATARTTPEEALYFAVITRANIQLEAQLTEKDDRRAHIIL